MSISPKEKRTWFDPIASDTGSSPSPRSLISSITVLRGRIASTDPWSDPSDRDAYDSRCRELRLRGDLDFEVGREEFHPRARSRNQHVRQDGKGMPPFHDSRDLRERSEKFVVGCLDLQHLLKSL